MNRIDLEIERRQAAKLKDLKSSRDKSKVDHALAQLQAAAEKDENLMPLLINAVKNYCTLGEISATLRSVFGRYEPKVSF